MILPVDGDVLEVRSRRVDEHYIFHGYYVVERLSFSASQRLVPAPVFRYLIARGKLVLSTWRGRSPCWTLDRYRW